MTYTLETLAAEQEELVLDQFDFDFAWALGVAIREAAHEASAHVAIEITHGLTPVFTTLMPGATPDNLGWAARKRTVVHRFHRASLTVRLEAERSGYDFNAAFRLPSSDYVASGGGVPLILRSGVLIGIATVSGLPDVEDHRMIVGAMRRLRV